VLQVQLARHLGFVTLPETSFFMARLATTRARLGALRRLQLALQDELAVARPALRAALAATRYWASRIGWWATVQAIRSPRRAADVLTRTLDARARRHGAPGWIEKSPRHFGSVEAIRRLVPGASFVFVFRDGREAVASIVHRARAHGGRFVPEAEPARAAGLWNASVAAARAQGARPDVCCVELDALLAAPTATLDRIADLLGLMPAPDTALSTEATRARHAAEEWKADPAVLSPPNSRWPHVFTEEERPRVVDHLHLDAYATLRRAERFIAAPS
jgi:hypothetical protein